MPSIKYIRKDFLKVTPADGIAIHVINSVGVIGGLSNALCSKFHGLRELITAHTATEELLPLGGVLVHYVPYKLLMAAIVGQVFPGPASSADTYAMRQVALRDGLMFTALENPGRDLYVPYMLACGQAGDSWDNIVALLDLPSQVYVCVPLWAERDAELLGRLDLDALPAASTMVVDNVAAPMRSYKVSTRAM